MGSKTPGPRDDEIEKIHRRKVIRNAAKVTKASGSPNAVATIIKVKTLAAEVGGLDNLKALFDGLSV